MPTRPWSILAFVLAAAAAQAQTITTRPAFVHAGQSIDLLVDGAPFYAARGVLFPMADGTSVRGPVQSGSVLVPHGSTSGQALVETASGDYFWFAITVNPVLRLHAAQRTLSSGELVSITALTLTTPSTYPISWRAESGFIDASGTFLAPVVSFATYVRIWGCLDGGAGECATVVVQVLPFRLDPIQLTLNPGESAMLKTWQGSGPVFPTWRALTKNITVSPNGAVTAGTGVFDGGSATVTASYNGFSQNFTLSITGPGAVANAQEFPDYVSQGVIQLASFAQVLKARGDWIYALSYEAVPSHPDYDPGLWQRAWLDAYQLDDRRRPLWMGAFEAPYSFSFSNQLIMEGDTLTIVGFEYFYGSGATKPNMFVSYDISGGVPVPIASATFDGNPAAYRRQGKDWSLTISPTEAVSLRVTDYSSNTVRELPLGYNPLYPQYTAEASGGEGWAAIFFSYTVAGAAEIVFFDTSGSSAVPISIQPAPFFGGKPSVVGNIVFCGGYVYRVAAGGADLLFTGPLERVVALDEASGRFLLEGGLVQPGYYVLDVSDPDHPKRSASIANFHNEYQGALGPDYIAMPGGPQNITINPIADAGIQQLDVFPASPFMNDLRVRDGYLFWTGYGVGGLGARSVSQDLFEVVDISRMPSRVVKQLDRPGDEVGWAIELIGNFAYVGTDSETVIYDISNPRNPVVRTVLAAPAISFALTGSTLYAGSYSGASKTIVGYDVSDPANPRLLSTTVVPGFAVALAARSGWLAAAFGSAGIGFYSTSPVAAPVLKQSTFGVYYGLAFNGNILYAAAGAQGLVTFDTGALPTVTFLSLTALVDVLECCNNPVALAVSYDPRGIAWVSVASNGRVYGVDVREPTQPRVIAMVSTAYDTYGEAQNALVSNGLLVVAGNDTAFDVNQPQNIGLFKVDVANYQDVQPLRTDLPTRSPQASSVLTPQAAEPNKIREWERKFISPEPAPHLNSRTITKPQS